DYTIMTAKSVNEASNSVFDDIEFSSVELTELRYAALLHDFGKIGVREQVLQKAARLHPGTFQAVLHRIDAARASARTSVFTEFHHRLVAEARAPPADEVHLSDAEVALRDAKLKHYRDTVIALQEPRPIAPREVAVIREMLDVTFKDADGRRQPLLLEDEAVDLQIKYATLNDDER